jgi:hypothetical protein
MLKPLCDEDGGSTVGQWRSAYVKGERYDKYFNDVQGRRRAAHKQGASDANPADQRGFVDHVMENIGLEARRDITLQLPLQYRDRAALDKPGTEGLGHAYYAALVRAAYQAYPITLETKAAAATATVAGISHGGSCYNCGAQGHMSNYCTETKVTCGNCGKEGHMTSTCKKKPASKGGQDEKRKRGNGGNGGNRKEERKDERKEGRGGGRHRHQRRSRSRSRSRSHSRDRDRRSRDKDHKRARTDDKKKDGKKDSKAADK